MAGRFLFQKFSSGMSRSSSLLGAHAAAASRAAAPGIPREAGTRTLSNVFHGAAVHPGTAVPSNRGIRGYTYVASALSNSRSLITQATRYLNTLPCSCAAAKTDLSKTGIPSAIINWKKPAFVDSVGAKRTFSSGASSKQDSWVAKLAALQARAGAWATNTFGEFDDPANQLTFALVLSTLGVVIYLDPPPAGGGTSEYNGQSSSRRCPGCCTCLAGGSKS
ncbi:hypothetical protein ACP70R_045135 [Stipagrostis hirtigluma subsp. patula]